MGFLWKPEVTVVILKAAIWGTCCFIDGDVTEIYILFGPPNSFCVGDWRSRLLFLHKTSLSQALRCR